MRRQWLMALGVDVAIMGSVAVILALISADVLPASLMAPVIAVGMLLSALPLYLRWLDFARAGHPPGQIRAPERSIRSG